MSENIEKIGNMKSGPERLAERTPERREVPSTSPEKIVDRRRAEEIKQKIYGQEVPRQTNSGQAPASAGNTRTVELLVERALKAPGEVEKIVAELEKSGDPYALDAFHDAYMKIINSKQ